MDFGEEAINSGETVSVTCTILKGDLPINIMWLHNNQSVADENGIMVSKAGKKISMLSIDSVQAEHAGTYTCLAENSGGKAQYSVDLHVNGISIGLNISYFNLIKHADTNPKQIFHQSRIPKFNKLVFLKVLN